MKNIVYIIIGISLLTVSSCKEEFLERQPQGTLTAGNFPSTDSEAIVATNGIYNTLRVWQFNTGGFPVMDIMSDEATKGSNPGDGIRINQYDDFTFTADIGEIENWYRTLYLGVRRSYLVIERVPDIDMEPNLRNRLLAEARFLRGYFYSILVRAFGDVPLVESSESADNLTRTDAQIIYDEIIFPDLEFAIENLPEKSEYSSENAGRVTKGAARALLARLYLFLGDFPMAEQYALEVINSQQYDLQADFANAFSVAGEHGSESVFEIGALPEGSLTLGGNQYANTQGVRGTPNWGWGYCRPAYPWIEKMDAANDPRLDPSVIFVGETIDGTVIIGDSNTPDTTYNDAESEIIEIETYNQKVYAAGEENNDRWGHNRRIIRYADVLLMAAEAMNENNKSAEALTYLNEVRQRADENGELPDITVTDKEDLREIIYEERSRELFMEGLRYWDLIRTDRAASVLGPLGFVEGKHELFPIPQSEVVISEGRISQNPNWN